MQASNVNYKKFGIEHHSTVYRISQVYDEGVCVYFYTGYKPLSKETYLDAFYKMEELFRETIKMSGGTISHHHGIGGLKSKWYKDAISDVAVQLYKSAKEQLDPKNIFGCENLLPPEDHKERRDKLKSKL